jgi:hypothetical protein
VGQHVALEQHGGTVERETLAQLGYSVARKWIMVSV